MKNISMNTIESLLNCIELNNEVCKNLEKAKTIDEVYNFIKKYGYKDTIEKFSNDIITFLKGAKEISNNELEEVTGGKIDLKQGVAGILSTLTVTGTMIPSIGAVKPEKTKDYNVFSISQIPGYILTGVGIFSLGAVLVAMLKSKGQVHRDQEQVYRDQEQVHRNQGIMDAECCTAEGKEVKEKLEKFVNECNLNGNSTDLSSSDFVIREVRPLNDESKQPVKILTFYQESKRMKNLIEVIKSCCKFRNMTVPDSCFDLDNDFEKRDMVYLNGITNSLNTISWDLDFSISFEVINDPSFRKDAIILKNLLESINERFFKPIEENLDKFNIREVK